MSRRKRRKKEKSRNKLAFGIIAVAFILILLAYYLFFLQSNQTSQPKAAIVDHLSFKEETKNETFKNSSIGILKTAGFEVTYYPGEGVTVDFFRNLVSQDYGVIVLRVHSAIISGLGDNKSLGLFTSEIEDESKYNTPSAPYYDDIYNGRIVRAYFPEDPTQYFAIAPGFIEKYGNFHDALIIMMGCDGLKYGKTAEAFIKKGAKVCIGWNGLVSTSHTDRATSCLLQHLAQGNTLETAVEKTMNEVGPDEMYFKDQGYNSTLEYYPTSAGNYTVKPAPGVTNDEIAKANTFWTRKKRETYPLKNVALC
jgi:hypothetical protein